MVKFYAVLSSFAYDVKCKRDERGATAVEYGLLVALIAAVIVLAVATLGGTILEGFNDTNSGIQGELGSGDGGGDTDG